MEAAGTSTSASDSSTKIVFSIRDVIHILFMKGLNKIVLWEEKFYKAKFGLLTQNSVITNIYFIVYNAISNFNSNEASQANVLNAKDKELTIEELNSLFEEEMENGQIDIKSIEYNILTTFKEFILKY